MGVVVGEPRGLSGVSDGVEQKGARQGVGPRVRKREQDLV